jgi:hypothetical protein
VTVSPTTIVDGRCERCDERADACECPATTVAVRELDRNPVHVRLSVFVGMPGNRQLAGEIVLRPAEWDELQERPMRSGWLLLPIEVLDVNTGERL